MKLHQAQPPHQLYKDGISANWKMSFLISGSIAVLYLNECKNGSFFSEKEKKTYCQ